MSEEKLENCPCCGQPWIAVMGFAPSWLDLNRCAAKAEAELGPDANPRRILQRTRELLLEQRGPHKELAESGE